VLLLSVLVETPPQAYVTNLYMPTSINIWTASDMANNGAQTGGTWTYTGSITPAPTPPVTYNGTADFTGITTAGTYEFTYTVTGSTETSASTHNVVYNTSTARTGDNCANAYYVGSFPTVPFTVEVQDHNDGQCPGAAAPTDSGETIPGAWTLTPYSGDIWYKVTLPSVSTIYTVKIEIDGSSFTNGITNPALQIFAGSLGSACGAKTLFGSFAATGDSQYMVGSFAGNINTAQELWIRVASPAGDEGDFILRIQGIC